MPLTDAQLVLLGAASQRTDGLLPRPAKLAGAALTRTADTLVKRGLADAMAVRTDQPHWRQDDAGTPVGLLITAAGLLAIGLEQDVSPTVAGDAVCPVSLPLEPARMPESSCPEPDATAVRSFRPTSKLARLVDLLSRVDGATLDTLTAALSWQPHTVRAALTRLRQGGRAVTSTKDQQNKTVYRIGVPHGVIGARAASDAAAQTALSFDADPVA